MLDVLTIMYIYGFGCVVMVSICAVVVSLGKLK